MFFQERDDFDVDTENQIIKPVHEESFLKETVKNVMVLASKLENHSEKEELWKERLGHVKNQLLESVKQRGIKTGRRDSIGSIGSIVSGSSKRDKEEDPEGRSHRIRTSSPVKS